MATNVPAVSTDPVLINHKIPPIIVVQS